MKVITIRNFPETVRRNETFPFQVRIDKKRAGELDNVDFYLDGRPLSDVHMPEEVPSKPDEIIRLYKWKVDPHLKAGGRYNFKVALKGYDGGKDDGQDFKELRVEEDVAGAMTPLKVTLTGAGVAESRRDQALWYRILGMSYALEFKNFAAYLKSRFGENGNCEGTDFSGMQNYEKLKEYGQDFMKDLCKNGPFSNGLATDGRFLDNLTAREVLVGYRSDPNDKHLPGNIDIVGPRQVDIDGPYRLRCLDDRDELRSLCMVELIWSYWHEEAMLVQTLKAISRRFQNRRAPSARNPLANLEITPLRPLNNFLWGYVQDEQHLLSVIRRAHEYEHHYGISLHGRAVASVRPADRRSKFMESFHTLLRECIKFYERDDDRTIAADGFPVFNAIRETHYLVAYGAHNQFGDLPETSRREMLTEQWLLARPEMREFLRGRPMVPYPEDWMDRVDSMKTLQGWSDVSVVHFHDLGFFGERLLLSIRYGSWAAAIQPNVAVNWARFFRSDVQAYVHAYRAVTGVDITQDRTDPVLLAERDAPPSLHLRRRLAAQSMR